MLDFCVKRWNLLRGENHPLIFLVNTERGPRFCTHIEPNRFPPCVPKAKLVVVCSRLGRVGWISPEEFWSGQELALTDFLKTEHDGKRCLNEFSYSALVKFAGNAYHTSSAGCFGLAVLTLPRFKSLLQRRPKGKVTP